MTKDKKSFTLTEKEHYILQCMIQRLNDKDCMQYMKDKGHELPSRFALYRAKKKIENRSQDRLNFIAQRGYIDQHLERIAQLETVQTELWKEYRTMPDDRQMDRVIILEKIAALQPYISTYYEATQTVFEKQVTTPIDEATIPTEPSTI